MAARDYSGDLPTIPPEDMIPWLQRKGLLKSNLLIYRMDSYTDPLTSERTRAVKLLCTACNRQIFAVKVPGPDCAAYASAPFGFVHPETSEHIISGNHCLCPECGVQVRVMHIGNIRNRVTTEERCVTTITRIDDKLVIIGWYIEKSFDKDGTVHFFKHGYEAYIVEEKSIVRLAAYQRFMSQISWGNWKQRKKYVDAWGDTGLVYPWNARLLRGSTAENSALNILLRDTKRDGTFPVSYLRLWQKKPQVENLVVQGASVLLSEMIKNEREGHSYTISVKKAFNSGPLQGYIDWKESAPAKMLGMTREEFRRCAKGKWGTGILQFWQEEKARGRSLTDDEVKLAASIGFHDCRWWQGRDIDWMKGARYINRQKAKNKTVSMSIYQDYWRIAQEIGEDMTLQAAQFPPNLMRAHDRVEGVRQWREEAKRQAERDARAHLFEKVYAKLEPLSWEMPDILIRPIRNEAELIHEGKALNHCVGSYAMTHIQGESPIFVIRRTSAPDVPWYTLQLRVKDLTVLQNRGKSNCDRTPEIQEFETAWLAVMWELRRQKKKTRKTRNRVLIEEVAV